MSTTSINLTKSLTIPQSPNQALASQEGTLLGQNHFDPRFLGHGATSIRSKSSLNEECGIFGIWGHPHANRVTYFGLHSLQHRGQEGAGITTANAQGQFYNFRGKGLLSQVFQRDEDLEALEGNRAIGHVRYSTAGSASAINNVQPFLFTFEDQSISLAHNGNLTNAKSLRRELEKEGAVFHSSSDSEVLIHLIRRAGQAQFEDSLKAALNRLHGGFNYVLLRDHALIGITDPFSFRPLALGQMKNGAYVLASETCALHVVGAQFVLNIPAGHYVTIDDQGYRLTAYTHKTQVAIESMEFVYFARPDSDIAGINVHNARKAMGRRLALEHPTPGADMVIGVPNSSLSAASGYAEASGLPLEMGLVKNQYVARTFIEPTQELREQGVRKKLSAVIGVVKDKSVVLVDDSIVRGTTSKRIVALLLEAGAKAVHLRISSPPLRFPSFYGIDMSTSSELLAANMTVKQMEAYLGCQSLGFLSVQGLIQAIGLNFDGPNGGLCTDVFTGHYPSPIADYEPGLLAGLTEIQKRVLRGDNVDD